MEQLRPQIEQHLRQQAMQDIQARLRQGAEIVFYDPSGQPLDPQPGAGTQQDQTGATAEQPQDAEADLSETTDEQAKDN